MDFPFERFGIFLLNLLQYECKVDIGCQGLLYLLPLSVLLTHLHMMDYYPYLLGHLVHLFLDPRVFKVQLLHTINQGIQVILCGLA